MAPDLDRLSPPPGVSVRVLDASAEPETVSGLGVKATPTIIARRDGVELWRTAGRKSSAELAAMLEGVDAYSPGRSDVVIRGLAGVALAAGGAASGSWSLEGIGLIVLAWGVGGWLRAHR